MVDAALVEFLVIFVIGISVVGQGDFRLEYCLLKLLGAGDQGLDIGRVGEVDLTLGNVGVVHVFFLEQASVSCTW